MDDLLPFFVLADVTHDHNDIRAALRAEERLRRLGDEGRTVPPAIFALSAPGTAFRELLQRRSEESLRYRVIRKQPLYRLV